MSIKNIPLNPGFQNGLQTEVAIVGAGVSGLYSAWRLLTGAGNTLPANQIQIFDMSNRIGGRLESATLPGMNVVGELGGMRYLTSQKIVTTLIQEIFSKELTNVNFPMGNTADLFMYLRKQRLKQDAWELAQQQGQKLQTNYLLNESDLGYNGDQLFNKIIYDVLMADPWYANNPAFTGKATQGPGPYDYSFTLTSRDWDAVKPQLTYCFEGSPYNGRKVNDIGFWNLIKDRVSQEGYSFLANAGGYYSNTINWNAAEAFPYMVGDFSGGDITYRTIQEGYDSIAYALADAYIHYKGACIWSENKLVTFTKDHQRKDTYKYELTFLNLQSNTQWQVYANKIILAMPRQSLELLDQYNFFFNIDERSELNYNIKSVIKEPSFKILMGFEYPWWKALNIDSGHSITDLPMRQVYYFGTDPDNQHSLLLGSYGDMETETFWKALSDDKVLFEVRPTASASLKELQQLNDVQATKMMVNEVMNQLRELHGPDVKIPDPYVTWFKDWTDDPFGAGYHAWKAGYSVKDVMPYMRKPLDSENIHICGEAYSDQQGWVEGAFCVAELMLQEHFGLDWPVWLDKDYYLGW